MTRARPSRAVYAAVGALVAMSAGVLTTAGAGAQSGACPSGGVNMARVTIDEPRGGSVTSPVAVRGRAEATLGLTRAELFAGTERVAAQEVPDPKVSLPFDLRWDARGRIGQVSLRVVVCGPGQVGSSLVWGESSVSVDIRPAVSTTAAPTTTQPPAQPQPAAPAVTPTTAAAANPARVSTTTPKTGSTKAATTSTAVGNPGDAEREAALPPPPTTIPTRPFILTEGADTKKPNRPLWVGVVVGLSGVAGLTFSAVFRWRRTPLPEVVEEPDLVDVRERHFHDARAHVGEELNPWVEGHLRRLGQQGLVLDLGCGRGFWLGWMAEQGISCVGVEPDIERARDAAQLGRVAVADGARLPLRDDAVDVVWCIHVLHHLPDPEQVLAEIRRVLRPGGHLILAETVEDNPVVRVGRQIWPHWDGVDIESRFTASALLAMVADAGLEVVDRRQHSLLSFAAWSLPRVARRAWLQMSRLEQRLPRRLDRWGAHLECVARAGAAQSREPAAPA